MLYHTFVTVYNLRLFDLIIHFSELYIALSAMILVMFVEDL